MTDNQKCTKCGERLAKHEIHRWWKTPPDEYLCCKCYVEGGGAPADWHPLCMKTYNVLHASHHLPDVEADTPKPPAPPEDRRLPEGGPVKPPRRFE
jgi:hypothetical protein